MLQKQEPTGPWPSKAEHPSLSLTTVPHCVLWFNQDLKNRNLQQRPKCWAESAHAHQMAWMSHILVPTAPEAVSPQTVNKYPMWFPGDSVINNLPAKQEMQVQFLDWEVLPKKEMATHSSILAWRIPRIGEPGGLQSIGLPKSWTWLSS